MDAMVALLLLHLPSITTLVVETNFGKETNMIGQAIFYTTKETNSALQHLRYIKISGLVDWNPVKASITNTHAILAMLYLPSIQYLEADIGNPPGLV